MKRKLHRDIKDRRQEPIKRWHASERWWFERHVKILFLPPMHISLYRFPQWEAQIEKRPAMKGTLFLPYIGETDDTNLSHEYLFLSMYIFVPFLGAWRLEPRPAIKGTCSYVQITLIRAALWSDPKGICFTVICPFSSHWKSKIVPHDGPTAACNSQRE